MYSLCLASRVEVCKCCIHRVSIIYFAHVKTVMEGLEGENNIKARCDFSCRSMLRRETVITLLTGTIVLSFRYLNFFLRQRCINGHHDELFAECRLSLAGLEFMNSFCNVAVLTTSTSQ